MIALIAVLIAASNMNFVVKEAPSANSLSGQETASNVVVGWQTWLHHRGVGSMGVAAVGCLA